MRRETKVKLKCHVRRGVYGVYKQRVECFAAGPGGHFLTLAFGEDACLLAIDTECSFPEHDTYERYQGKDITTCYDFRDAIRTALGLKRRHPERIVEATNIRDGSVLQRAISITSEYNDRVRGERMQRGKYIDRFDDLLAMHHKSPEVLYQQLATRTVGEVFSVSKQGSEYRINFNYSVIAHRRIPYQGETLPSRWKLREPVLLENRNASSLFRQARCRICSEDVEYSKRVRHANTNRHKNNLLNLLRKVIRAFNGKDDGPKFNLEAT